MFILILNVILVNMVRGMVVVNLVVFKIIISNIIVWIKLDRVVCFLDWIFIIVFMVVLVFFKLLNKLDIILLMFWLINFLLELCFVWVKLLVIIEVRRVLI